MKKILISLVVILVMTNAFAITSRADVVVGVMPGQPYSEELTEVMDQDLQRYIWRLATDHNLPYEETNLYYAAMIGLAEGESEFNANAVNAKNKEGSVDRGLFQINSTNIAKLKRLGLIAGKSDLFDPYKNAACADYMFFECWKRYGYSEKAYGYYLYGRDHANNKYTARVWEKMEKWRKTLY